MGGKGQCLGGEEKTEGQRVFVTRLLCARRALVHGKMSSMGLAR